MTFQPPGRCKMHQSLVGLILLLGSGANPAPNQVDYAREIKPLLLLHCQSCHGALNQKGGLRVDAIQFLRRGGESGALLGEGKPTESLLLDALTGSNGMQRMPAEGPPLSEDEIAKVRRWIEQGGHAPAEEPVPEDPRQHWSYQSPVRPDLPTVKRADWVLTPIDTFIAAEQEQHGVIPVPEASRAVWLRRVYIDLIGLPPSRQELHAFLADTSPMAYERVVDRLLESPHYGERWGRHWMDVWRYSDWDGYGKEVRESHPHIWRWRDWIVESLNADRGYDQMIREMLAGDELAPDHPEAVRATGFLVRNWYRFNRNTWLDRSVEHTAKAFLGMTLNCARCHDHMHDPVVQPEYYRFRAYFEPHDIRIDSVSGAATGSPAELVRVFDAHLENKTFVFRRGDDKQPDKDNPVTPATPTVFKIPAPSIQPVTLPVGGFYAELNVSHEEQVLKQARDAIQAARQQMHKQEQSLQQVRQPQPKPQAPPSAETPAIQDAKDQLELARRKLVHAEAVLKSLLCRAAADRAVYGTMTVVDVESLKRQASQAHREEDFAEADVQALESQIEVRKVGTPKDPAAQKKQEAARAKQTERDKKRDTAKQALTQVDTNYPPFGKVYPRTSTGRRTALANWIVTPHHPRTSRVAVNHIWLRHFGSPLVSTMFDFGINGKRPTHPALLDWLATELERQKWQMKPLHKLIVLSRTYRLQSFAPADFPARKGDPENVWLWRMNPHRMEAEVVRDATLAVSGQLDRTLRGEELAPTDWTKIRRRSLYFRSTMEKRVTFLALFDSPNVLECYKRNESIVPQQALALANSPLSIQLSRILATQLTQEAGASSQPEVEQKFLYTAFETILSRPPTLHEQQMCLQFLKQQQQLLTPGTKLQAIVSSENVQPPPASDPYQRAREDLILVLMNHNDFITVR